MAYGFVWRVGGDCGLFFLSAQSIPFTFLYWRTLHQSSTYTCLVKSQCFTVKCFSGSRPLEDSSVNSEWAFTGVEAIAGDYLLLKARRELEDTLSTGCQDTSKWREQDLAAPHRCLRVPLPQKWHQLCLRATPAMIHGIGSVIIN